MADFMFVKDAAALWNISERQVSGLCSRGKISGAVKQVSGKEKVEAVLVNGQELPADGLFILRNSIAPAALVEELVLEEGYIKVNHKMETNVPGLYAAGDCTGKPLQVSKAVGEGLIAAQMAAAYLDGHKS